MPFTQGNSSLELGFFPQTTHEKAAYLIDHIIIDAGVFIDVAVNRGANEHYIDSLLHKPMHGALRWKLYQAN